MARSRARRRRGGGRGGLKGPVTIAFGLLLVLGIGATYVYKSSAYQPTDKNTFCLKNSAPPSATVILLDATDTLSAVQKQVITIRIMAEISDLIPRYGALQFYTVGPIVDDLLKPHFSLCNPGRSKEIDPLWGNPRLVEKKWKEGFSKKLDHILSQLLKSGEAKTSPIMEAMQSVSVSTFLDEFKDSKSKRLIVISDMIQNTSEFSHYKSTKTFDQFRKTSYFQKMRPYLKGVDVEILYIRRKTRRKIQGESHVSFWQQFVVESGGILSRVVPIEG